MISEQEKEDMIRLVAIKTILFPVVGLHEHLYNTLKQYYGDNITQDVLSQYEYMHDTILAHKRGLIRDLYNVAWANMTGLTESRTKTLQKTGDKIVETTVVTRHATLPQGLLLTLSEQAFQVHSNYDEAILLGQESILEKKLIEQQTSTREIL